jgi:hypothetical protein
MNRVKKPILIPKQVEDTWGRDRSCGRRSLKVRGRQKNNPKKIKKAPLKKAIVLIHSFINRYVPLRGSSITPLPSRVIDKNSFRHRITFLFQSTSFARGIRIGVMFCD